MKPKERLAGLMTDIDNNRSVIDSGMGREARKGPVNDRSRNASLLFICYIRY